MTDIPINPVTRRVQFTGNTGTGPFAFTFNIFVSSDIAVYKNSTLLTLTTDYTVTIAADGTGSVTLTGSGSGTPVILADVLTIVGARDLSRTTDFVTAGDLRAVTLNEQLDSTVIMAQQLDEKSDRALKFDQFDVYGDATLPVKASRLGAVLAFNATTGNPEAGPTIADVSTLAAITADIATLADIQDGTVATDAITNVNTIRTDVTTVAGVAANVTTVAGISANVTTVAGVSANVTTVAGIDTEVSTLAGLDTEILALYADLANINTKVGKTADTGSAILPAGTTGQRDVTPTAGYIRYNTTTNSFEGYGASWMPVSGASASTVVTKPDAYTVGSSDLGYILIFTGSGNEYATLGSAATLGSGFYVTIINQSGNTHIINRTGSDTFTNNGSTGDTSYKLASGASVTLVSDGTSKWLSKNIAPYLYAECNNNSGDFNPVATGSGSVALGRSAAAYGTTSFAAGTNSSYGGSTTNGSGAVALGGSYASGTDSFAAAIADNTSSYGATGANSIAIGQLAKATAANSVAIGDTATSTTANLIALGGTTDTVQISGTYTLPTTDGTTGQVLTTDGSGAVTFADAGGGGTALELYAENPSSPTAPSATGANAVAIGTGAVASGTNSTALGRANAGGLDSFAAAIGNVSATYGAQANGSISIGTLSKATIIAGTAVGYGATSTHQASSAFGYAATTTANNQIALGGSGITARISGAYTLPTTDGTNGQVLTTDGSGAVTFATAGGGGASEYTIDNKTLAYTVVSGDLGKILNYTSGTVDVTLTALSSLTTGFHVSIWNSGTGVISIKPNSVDGIGVSAGNDYDSSDPLKLEMGTGVTLVNSGTYWQIYSEKAYDYYHHSVTLGANAKASNNYAMALGNGSSASGVGAIAVGTGQGHATTASSSHAVAIGLSTASGSNSTALGTSYASGSHSFAAAITNNTSSYGATGANSVAIGDRVKATGNYSSGIGRLNTVSGPNGAGAIGQSLTVSGEGAFAAGHTCFASGAYSQAIGSGANTQSIYGKFAKASGYFSNYADRQYGLLVLAGQTTDATPKALTANNSTASTTNQIILPNNSAFSFSGTIIARQQAADGSNYASWEIKGALLRDANAASTVLGNGIVNKLFATAGASAWAIALTADTTNGGLKIEATGAAATDIRWVATVNTSEVTYA